MMTSNQLGVNVLRLVGHTFQDAAHTRDSYLVAAFDWFPYNHHRSRSSIAILILYCICCSEELSRVPVSI